jgi:hypothetical protein
MAHTLGHKNVSKHNTGGVILITSEHATPAWAQEGREAAKTFLSASRPANRKSVAGFNSGWLVGRVAQITRGRARCPFLMVHHNTFCVITSYCVYMLHRFYYGTGQICSIYNTSNDNQRQCFYSIKSLMRSYYTRAIMQQGGNEVLYIMPNIHSCTAQPKMKLALHSRFAAPAGPCFLIMCVQK